MQKISLTPTADYQSDKKLSKKLDEWKKVSRKSISNFYNCELQNRVS